MSQLHLVRSDQRAIMAIPWCLQEAHKKASRVAPVCWLPFSNRDIISLNWAAPDSHCDIPVSGSTSTILQNIFGQRWHWGEMKTCTTMQQLLNLPTSSLRNPLQKSELAHIWGHLRQVDWYQAPTILHCSCSSSHSLDWKSRMEEVNNSLAHPFLHNFSFAVPSFRFQSRSMIWSMI